MSDTLVPTQADRDAAAECSHLYAMAVLSGKGGGDEVLVQAFARHALRTTPNLATAVEDERIEQVARQFVIRVHDHLGKGRTGQASLWSHVYPQFKDELREIANDVANTVVRTSPPTLPDDRDAVIADLKKAIAEAVDILGDSRNCFREGEQMKWIDDRIGTFLVAHARRTALSKHDRNEGGDDGQG